VPDADARRTVGIVHCKLEMAGPARNCRALWSAPQTMSAGRSQRGCCGVWVQHSSVPVDLSPAEARQRHIRLLCMAHMQLSSSSARSRPYEGSAPRGGLSGEQLCSGVDARYMGGGVCHTRWPGVRGSGSGTPGLTRALHGNTIGWWCRLLKPSRFLHHGLQGLTTGHPLGVSWFDA
jgi:hypothetical protein